MAARHLPLTARCHETGDTKTVRLPADVALKIVKYGPESKFYELRGDSSPLMEGSSVAEVLLDPVAIFGGIREHQGGGFCYAGKASQRWTNGGARCPPPPAMVFAVYLNARYEVYEWR